jgi:hypothetical protein
VLAEVPWLDDAEPQEAEKKRMLQQVLVATLEESGWQLRVRPLAGRRCACAGWQHCRCTAAALPLHGCQTSCVQPAVSLLVYPPVQLLHNVPCQPGHVAGTKLDVCCTRCLMLDFKHIIRIGSCTSCCCALFCRVA